MVLLDAGMTSESSDSMGCVIVILFIPIFLYIYLAILVGNYANKNGHNGILYFLISILATPLIGYIVVALLGETNECREERIRRETAIRIEEEMKYRQQYGQYPPQQFPQAPLLPPQQNQQQTTL